MSQVFVMDVDTQRDFMFPDGALYVKGAEKLIPRIRKVFDLAKRAAIPVLSSVDAHSADDPEFQQFPPHCIKGTSGQKKLEESRLPHALILENKPLDRNLVDLTRKHPQIIVEKQTFDAFGNPATSRLLRILPPRAMVLGVATEYCVKAAVMGLLERGVKTALLTDAVSPVNAAHGKEAIQQMRQAGVELLDTVMLLETLGG